MYPFNYALMCKGQDKQVVTGVLCHMLADVFEESLGDSEQRAARTIAYNLFHNINEDSSFLMQLRAS